MALALVLAAGAVTAQEPAQQLLPKFSESVEVRVLDLDVDVTDAKGAPVPDLKKDDFTVKVAGKVVPIEYFARVEEGTIHAPDVATAPPEDVLAMYRKGEEAYVPRNFLIYVDVGYLPPGRRNASLNALRDLVTRLGPNDGARVVLFNRYPKVLVDWTTSKEAVMAALSEIERQSPGMSRLQSQVQTLALIDSSGTGRRAASSRMQLARQYGQEVGAEIQTMIGSMKNELVTLTPLNGKRAFLFVSGGFEFQPGYVMAQYAAGGFPSLSNIDVRQIPQEVGSLIQAANGNGVTFYTVDGTGLTIDEAVGAEGSPGNFQQGLENRPSLVFQARLDRQTGMQNLAYDTGGQALLNTNDFQKGLSRIYQDVSTYYSLGVSLSKLGIPAGYQDVRVTVNRPGTTVRARRGFEQLSENALVANRARATMLTDLAYNAVPLTIQTAPAVAGKKLYELPVTLGIPASALTFLPDGDKATAKVEFYIGSLDDKGNRSDLNLQEATFTIPADRAGSSDLVRYDARLQTKKGNYRITVNARDAASGKMGTARANVRVE
jgi:VWFA-related protein